MLTGKQRRALLLLVSGCSGREVAKAVKVSETTISQWINHHPEFMEELARLQEEATRQALAQLSGSTLKAVETIQHLLDAKNESERLKAAQYVLKVILQLE